MKWRVGDGESINVWDEAWLPGDSVTVVPTPNLTSLADLVVANLIDKDAGEWNWDVINALFTPEDANLIRSIPLSKRLPTDVRYWWPSNDGIYSTKSGYWLGKLGHIRGWEQHYGADFDVLWRLVWETICHAIFECANVRQIWNPSPFHSLLCDAPMTNFGEMLLWVSTRLNKDELLSFSAMAWAAWSYRNSVIFNNPWSCVVNGTLGFMKLVGEYKKYNAAVSCVRGSGVQSRSSWQVPNVGCVKINTDAAMLAGIGINVNGPKSFKFENKQEKAEEDS
uniref:Uncharacterized protein n=1 Tax=Chenopodium quinoa TaxID=63459 RepID=A0A803LCK6_CHEQI